MELRNSVNPDGGSDHQEPKPAAVPQGSPDGGAAPVALDPDLVAQFAEIREDYGRERIRVATRTGLRGPLSSCAMSLVMLVLFRSVILVAILYSLAVASLYRAFQTLHRTDFLDSHEKAVWSQSLARTAAFIIFTGVLYFALFMYQIVGAVLWINDGR